MKENKKYKMEKCYSRCMKSGEKICELPGLYSDLFCSKKCQQPDAEKEGECFTQCKMGCIDEMNCPHMMRAYCEEECREEVHEIYEPYTPPLFYKKGKKDRLLIWIFFVLAVIVGFIILMSYIIKKRNQLSSSMYK